MKSYNNPLYDSEFLKELDSKRDREIFARIISLTFQERPIESIEGRVTSGSINIDGASAVRRTCSLSMVAKDLNINSFYWGIKNKFKLEIGLKNEINPNYPNIIWFPQGIYVITSFNTSQTTNNYSISISGKDKMCLLNGDLGGNLPATIDFGTEEYVDLESKVTTYIKVPIKKIIREALHTYALEPYHNIIINDLDEAGLELLEYRGDDPLYLLYDKNKHEYIQQGRADQECYFNGKSATLDSGEIEFLTRVDLINENATEFTLVPPEEINSNTITYKAAKIEYGQTAGYRIIELVYAGELISSIGESLTSILDKIKNMLGEFEYFYDLNGRFIFQRKRNYINQTFNNEVNNDDNRFIENSAYNTRTIYQFEGGNLITSYQNNPNLQNLKNDFSIWGERQNISGAIVPIHYRYAIDQKPYTYTTIEVSQEEANKYVYFNMKAQKSKTYTIDDYDWREIIYQMALDFYRYNQLDSFLAKVIEANKGKGEEEEDLYPFGETGYEQYYIDLQKFWRQLYDPNPPIVYPILTDIDQTKDTFVLDTKKYSKGLFTDYTYVQYKSGDKDEVMVLWYNDNTKRYELQPLLDTISVDYGFKEEDKDIGETANNYYISCGISELYPDGKRKVTKGSVPFVQKSQLFRQQQLNDLTEKEIKDRKTKDGYEIYIQKKENSEEILYYYTYKSLIALAEKPEDNTWYIKVNYKEDRKKLDEWISEVGLIDLYYKSNTEIYTYIPQTPLGLDGKPIPEKEVVKNYNKFYYADYDFFTEEDLKKSEDSEEDSKKIDLYWNKNISEAPDLLNFWFDFLDTEGELSQFQIQLVGDRTKVVNDKDIKSIYFREVPEIIFIDKNQRDSMDKDHELIDLSNYWHFTRMYNIPSNLFNISAQGKSAQDALEELMYNHSYCIESITIQSVPIYYLEPNTRIFVRDDSSKINGEYLVSRISLPLTYNGTMSITATKAPTRLY